MVFYISAALHVNGQSIYCPSASDPATANRIKHVSSTAPVQLFSPPAAKCYSHSPLSIHIPDRVTQLCDSSYTLPKQPLPVSARLNLLKYNVTDQLVALLRLLGPTATLLYAQKVFSLHNLRFTLLFCGPASRVARLALDFLRS